VSGNCNGITGVQQDRPDGDPGLLEDISVRHNTIAGPGGMTGVASDNGSDLRNRNIVFSNNAVRSNTSYCKFRCGD